VIVVEARFPGTEVFDTVAESDGDCLDSSIIQRPIPRTVGQGASRHRWGSEDGVGGIGARFLAGGRIGPAAAGGDVGIDGVHEGWCDEVPSRFRTGGLVLRNGRGIVLPGFFAAARGIGMDPSCLLFLLPARVAIGSLGLEAGEHLGYPDLEGNGSDPCRCGVPFIEFLLGFRQVSRQILSGDRGRPW
jgi:hypothetical protein